MRSLPHALGGPASRQPRIPRFQAGHSVRPRRAFYDSSSSSDFASFRDAAVPYAMFFGDDVSRIHTDRDTIGFVRPEMLGGAAVATVVLLESPKFAALIKDQ